MIRNDVRAWLLLVLTLGCTLAARADSSTWWQVTIAYKGDTLRVEQADPIRPMRKTPLTPGLAGAVLRLACTLEWLDKTGGVLATSPLEIPLGRRCVTGDPESEQVLVPAEGVVVLRVPGPDPAFHATSARLTRSAPPVAQLAGLTEPRAFRHEQATLALPPPKVALDTGLVGTVKTQYSGPDDNRPVIVVLGDGYTQANLDAGRFANHLEAYMDGTFRALAPWNTYHTLLNVYRIDVASNQEGTDRIAANLYVDTFFGTNDQFPYIDSWGFVHTIADQAVGVGVWDKIILVVNSPYVGGVADDAGGAMCIVPCADERYSSDTRNYHVLLHEFGHIFAGLADEYLSATPTRPRVDAGEPNIQLTPDRETLKWKNWVEPDTPLPTPPVAPYLDLVGAFEGAKYYATGVWRPAYACEMRQLYAGFCPVCTEAHVLALTDRVQLADTVTPPPAAGLEIGPAGVDFTVTPVPLNPLSFQWRLDGQPIANADGTHLLLTSATLGSKREATLELRLTHETPLVRKHPVQAIYRWELINLNVLAVREWAVYE